MNKLSFIQQLVIWIPPVLFAITVHETAHGFIAYKLGDPTAMMLGRLTLNPIKHIDPVGTVLLPIIMLWQFNFVFGWAKPVPVTWENLKSPKRDMALVALAGPASNLVMALLWAAVMKTGYLLGPDFYWLSSVMVPMGDAGIFINTILMMLNLVPIPPLDGSRVVSGLLPGPWAWKFSRIEPYGLFILLALLISGILWKILSVPTQLFIRFIHLLFGL